MEKQPITKIGFQDPDTKEEYQFDVTGELIIDGEKWSGNVKSTTSKTEIFLFEIARFMASQKEGSPYAAEARRVLNTIYSKLTLFTIQETDDGGGGFNIQWMIKEGLKGPAIEAEMKELIQLPIFRHFLGKIWPVKDGQKIEVTKSGGGIRMGAHWSRARFELKKAKKTTRKISPEDMRLEFTLAKLLRDHSTHRDKEHDLYLLGNGGEAWDEIPAQMGGRNFQENKRVAVLEIPVTELYKSYTGKASATISRDERRRVDKLLEDCQSDIITLALEETDERGRVKRLEISRPKIIVDRGATMTEEEAEIRRSGGELPEAKTYLRIQFNVLFTHEIRNKYGLLPDDYLQRMEKAIGGGRSSGKHWLLNDYLNEIRGHGKAGGYEPIRDFETLVTVLDLGRFKKKQGIPATEKEIEEAIRVAKEVNLVLSWSKEPGAKGQKQYQFKLNPEFGKQ